MAPYDLLAKSERLTLLYCYAAEDQEALTLLEPYLRPFMNERVQIKSLNMNVASLQLVESSVLISEAHIILLLVSDAFKRFGDGKNDVMEYILRRERLQEAHVFPVVFRKTRWTGTSFSMMRPLPMNNAPLQSEKGVLDQVTMDMFTRELQAEIDNLLGPIEATPHSGEAHESSPPAQEDMGNGQIQALAEVEAISTDPVKLPSPTQSTRFDDEEDTITIRHTIHPSWHGSRSVKTYGRKRSFRQRFQRSVPKVVIIVVVMCLAFGLFFFVVPRLEAPIPPTQERNGIGVRMLGGEPIGISDGTIIFDTNRPNAEAKKLAAEALLRGDIGKAEQQWGQALNTPEDENDAEAMIYRENQSIAEQPYITVVVPTVLSISTQRQSRDTLNTGRLILQGAYMVQKEVNRRNLLPNQLKLRILIGNAGDTAGHARELAQQILHLRASDKTFVGVMGWPVSSKETLDAINLLAGQRVTMISPTASSIELGSTTSVPYFFRVSPNDAAQAEVAARFLKSSLKVARVAVFRDPTNPYSNTLGDQFCRFWTGVACEAVSSHASLKPVTFQRDNAASIRKALAQTLALQPQFLYFAGYSDDLRLLQGALQQAHRQIPIMGGDALYVLSSTDRDYYRNLFFTAFTYPDIWGDHNVAPDQSHKPLLYTTFAPTFDHLNVHSPGTYNYTRPQNDAVLSYDAMYTLINACQATLRAHGTCTSEELRSALLALDGTSPARTFQGASGQISFQADGNAKDKIVVVLCVDGRGFTRLIGVYNRFLVGGPLLSKTYPDGGCQ